MSGEERTTRSDTRQTGHRLALDRLEPGNGYTFRIEFEDGGRKLLTPAHAIDLSDLR